MYISSNSQLKCFRAYPLPGMATKTNYLTYPSGQIYATRDIAYEQNFDAQGYIWVANGFPGKPVQVVSTSGTIVDFVASSVIPSAYGLTFDDEGYLWASSGDDTIYQVNVFDTALDQTTWGSIKATIN
jgi:hypothetical protein